MKYAFIRRDLIFLESSDDELPKGGFRFLEIWSRADLEIQSRNVSNRMALTS